MDLRSFLKVCNKEQIIVIYDSKQEASIARGKASNLLNVLQVLDSTILNISTSVSKAKTILASTTAIITVII